MTTEGLLEASSISVVGYGNFIVRGFIDKGVVCIWGPMCSCVFDWLTVSNSLCGSARVLPGCVCLEPPLEMRMTNTMKEIQEMVEVGLICATIGCQCRRSH